ncbi:N-acetylmuramoyl-L-alanine amidase [Pontixanthobacter aestiaquae]|uniref:N-acetylmuramoyl-L-alanine amidase n=1 Tax=Pontixanthobacter aestiaquae TaxID=1509367 RepID=A0A844Z730_9SPHN|nr:N-acetylmuramoyl-L-alanine amidase [Pontixanthobacter aestiaquae]MDN3646131.1 N-acetylmuramoyl-L-alanine amidase [Pontixanthobacter aestiaquae]MXO82877.1 N-acetylmuramoyl-L-alanine amidase [Pontixanthobacter aestiaquae]
MADELVHHTRLSPNCNERKLPISMVVLHYTEMKPVETALERLCDPEASVSAHYLISEEGEVTLLVPEEKRAWHAGASFWRGTKDVNSASIGIELDHPGHGLGYRPFEDAQIEALVPLLHRIVQTYDIAKANVVGHSDVAPARKTDPGELFPWDRLADYGLATAVPKIQLGNPFDNDGAFFLALERYGYDITDSTKAVEAFQRRWRPHKMDGQVDGEICAILFQLLLDRDRGAAR